MNTYQKNVRFIDDLITMFNALLIYFHIFTMNKWNSLLYDLKTFISILLSCYIDMLYIILYSEQCAHYLYIKLLNIHLQVLIVCLFSTVRSIISYCYQAWTCHLRLLLIFISGASQCRKSFLVRSMLHHRDELFEPKITFCYGEYQSAFDSMRQTIPNFTFVEGFPKT